ncbi:MAG: hypothetical protein Kow00105_02500 [Phycisphaeraceae bacterium]
MSSGIRFTTYPRTAAPPDFVYEIISVFKEHGKRISTLQLTKGLVSDSVLKVLSSGLLKLGFEVEGSKSRDGKIERPVFYGENGVPSIRYEIDAYQPTWKCGLEVEAGRAVLGNAIYRDLFQAMVMTELEHLCLAVPNVYRYRSSGKNFGLPGKT